MQREQIFIKYRAKLIRTYVYIALGILVFELGAHFFLLESDGADGGFFNSYLLFYVAVPSTANFIAIGCVYLINKSSRFKSGVKNAAVLYCLSTISFIVSCVHGRFLAMPASLCLPVIVSSIFGDRKLTQGSWFISIICLGLSALITWYTEALVKRYLFFNTTVIFMLIVAAYMTGRIFIEFEQENAIEIENRILRQQSLEQQLQRDQMTGLFNYAAFQTRISNAIELSNKNGTPLSLAVIDLDDFKRINDTYGHESGNIVLINLARVMEKYCEATDMICRYGGEEFTIIFNGRGINDSLSIISNILNHFGNMKFSFTEENVTFSCGLCEYRDSLTYQEFFNLADDAMYRAKKTGKNRVLTA